MASPSQELRASNLGALWAIIAMLCFSINDVLVKFLSGDYPLYQVIWFRTIFGLAFILFVIVPITGSPAMLRTKRLRTHIIRGLCVVFANLCFFLGLASMPLAEAVAIFFISPLLISIFSVVFLKETVGPRRWAAIGMGMVGVLIVLRPGTSAFQLAALLPLVAAVGYASLHMMTRRIGISENTTSMAFYIQLTFFIFSSLAALLTFDGRFDVYDHPSLEFLFRAWVWPTPRDLLLMAALGLTSSTGGFMISRAYSRSEAALVAPMEYIAMPMAVFWGLTVFGEWPDSMAWAGIALIMVSGLVLIWRETVARRRMALDAPTRL